MKGRKGFTLIELLVVIAIIAVLAAILFPVFAKARKAAQNSDCQSNMKQIGSAMKMYLSDWTDTYPTNKTYASPGVPAANISVEVTLSQPGATKTDGTPLRFQYGLNWVEALYNYVESSSKSGPSSWKCQAAGNKTYPTTSATAMVSYAMNYNLCEQPEGVIKGASNLMAVRELDRLMNSVLRPTNDSNANSAMAPLSPFLDSSDEGIPMPLYKPSNGKLHGTSSNILFADGHVKSYATSYMPDQADITSTKAWDTETSQWYNYAAGSNKPKIIQRTIAITP